MWERKECGISRGGGRYIKQLSLLSINSAENDACTLLLRYRFT